MKVRMPRTVLLIGVLGSQFKERKGVRQQYRWLHTHVRACTTHARTHADARTHTCVHLRTLDLTVLRWFASKVVVELNCFVRGDTAFILGRFCAKPKVNVPFQLCSRLLCVQDDVRVAREELSLIAVIV